ncbi:MAG TPA: NAD(P)H-binding protein [Myxococcota bacterium]
MPNPTEATGRVERVLVTGANGNLGRRLLERIARDPAARRRVRALVRSKAAAAVLERLPEGIRPEVSVVDYTDSEALVRAAEGCTGAVHLVGIIRETRGSRYADAHEATTRALAAAAPRAGLRRIVYLSILGSRPDASNACLASKGRAEQILLAGAVPALVLRVPMVIGAGDFVSRTLRKQARARFVPLLRGGRGREQPIDGDDVVSAILAGLGLPAAAHLALDLAGPESLSRRELLARSARLWNSHPIAIPLPYALEHAMALAAETLLANPPLTRAMLGVLDHDDDIDPKPACDRLGLQLTPLDATLRRCVGPGSEGA